MLSRSRVSRVEAPELRLAGAAHAGDGAAQVLAQPAHAPARAGPEGDAPEHRGAGQGGRFLGERIRRRRLACIGIESPAREQPTQPATQRGQEAPHLLVGRRRGRVKLERALPGFGEDSIQRQGVELFSLPGV